MREIKFRVWHKATELMDEVVTIDLHDEGIGVLYANPITQGEDIQRFDFDEIELMQYTGLKDKNGVEIFEGDVLYFEPYETHINDRVVEYIDGAYHGRLIRSGYSKLLAECLYETKVIGNIYKNPELLEEKK